VWEFIQERREQILFNAYQHTSLVVQCVIVATLIGVLLAILVIRFQWLEGVANTVSAIGLTIPAFAAVGLLLPLMGIGAITAFVAVLFYAVFPILRNAVVGLRGVDPTLLESARGMGMSEVAVLTRVRLPLAWPVILAGIRVSMQMSFGVAAIAAYALANAVNYAVVGTVGIVIIALLVDLVLVLLGRLTTSKGIRA
jgi:osmoprotectant transport system permease protein